MLSTLATSILQTSISQTDNRKDDAREGKQGSVTVAIIGVFGNYVTVLAVIALFIMARRTAKQRYFSKILSVKNSLTETRAMFKGVLVNKTIVVAHMHIGTWVMRVGVSGWV